MIQCFLSELLYKRLLRVTLLVVPRPRAFQPSKAEPVRADSWKISFCLDGDMCNLRRWPNTSTTNFHPFSRSLEAHTFVYHAPTSKYSSPNTVTTTVRSANFLPARAASAFCADSGFSYLM